MTNLPKNEGEMMQGILSILQRLNYFELTYYTYEALKDGALHSESRRPFYEMDLRYDNLYGGRTLIDIVMFHPDKFPGGLAIELKWQEAKGTVDEKFPYQVMNIKSRYPCEGAIIILEGRGYRPGAEKWMREQVGGKLIGVYNWLEFLQFVEDGGL